jgi:hypothetical protein
MRMTWIFLKFNNLIYVLVQLPLLRLNHSNIHKTKQAIKSMKQSMALIVPIVPRLDISTSFIQKF